MLSTEDTTENDLLEKFPLDFSAYLGERVGVDRDTAMAALGRWLKQYERASSRPGLAAGRPRRSGVFLSPSVAEDHATAKTSAG